VPYALPAVCLDISSAEAQLGQVHATAGVTDVYDVTGLIHGPAAGVDAFCIYLESVSFSLFSVP